MRRLVLIGLLVALVPWVVLGIVRAATDDETDKHYMVRAVFDNAAALVPDEDVKVAGAPVGVVDSMEVTEDNKAAITLRIDNDAFTPFKTDAECTIRPQGLIGEKFVECEPGSASAEALDRIEEGDGEGEHLLPIEQTSSPVDLDLLNDIMRLPYRQRFAILLNEFGTGLAGRGAELNEVIHRANPALRETDRVLKILAGQNRVLADLARDSDRALAPLAREKDRLAGFIVQANRTGEATAERRADIRESIALLPRFLRELRPLMADLEGFTDQGTPVLRDLGTAASDLDRLIRAQGTLADASRESFPSLGDALERGRPALLRARPLIRNLGRLGREARPVSEDLAALTASLDETQGPERILDLLYYLALSTNGFDEAGHYLRAGLVTNNCTRYALVPGACPATFWNPAEEATVSDTVEARNAAAPSRKSGGSVAPTGTLLQGMIGPAGDKAAAEQRERTLDRVRRQSSEPSPALGEEEPALEYLLGDDE
jgi:ABC-type transporter Mla subunit MlaD